MKKYLIMPLVAAMALMMAGCAGESGEASSTPTPQIQSGNNDITNPPVNTGDSTGELPAMDDTDPEDMEDSVIEVEPSNDSPAAALVGGLNAYKNMDMAGFEQYFTSGFSVAMKTFNSGEEADEQSLNMIKVLYSPLEWVVRTESVDGEEAIVEVSVLNKPGVKAMEEAATQLAESVDESVTDEQYRTRFTELLQGAMDNEELEVKEASVLVYMEKGEGGWTIADDNLPLFIAVQGGSDVEDLEEMSTSAAATDNAGEVEEQTSPAPSGDAVE